MKTETPQFTTACMVAPLIAPLAGLLIIMVVGEDLRGPAYQVGAYNVAELFGVAGMFVVLGAPIAYAVMFAFGLPLYFLARKFDSINFWSVTFGSAFVAVIPILLLFAQKGLVVYEDPAKSSLLFYLAFAIIGYLVGLVFWFVSGLYRQSAPD